MARVDFLVDADSEAFVVNEINTIPYMTARSSFFASIEAATGVSYSDLLTGLIERAITRTQSE